MTVDTVDARVFAAVKRNLLDVVPDLDPDDVTIDQAMADVGCNSIDRAEVVTLTMEDLGVEVPVMEFRDVTNIRSLVDVLARHVR